MRDRRIFNTGMSPRNDFGPCPWRPFDRRKRGILDRRYHTGPFRFVWALKFFFKRNIYL